MEKPAIWRMLAWTRKQKHIHHGLRGYIDNLSGKVSRELRGNVSPHLHGDCSNITGTISFYLRGDLSNISGKISRNLWGDVTQIKGDVTGITGNLDEIEPHNLRRQVLTNA